MVFSFCKSDTGWLIDRDAEPIVFYGSVRGHIFLILNTIKKHFNSPLSLEKFLGYGDQRMVDQILLGFDVRVRHHLSFFVHHMNEPSIADIKLLAPTGNCINLDCQKKYPENFLVWGLYGDGDGYHIVPRLYGSLERL